MSFWIGFEKQSAKVPFGKKLKSLFQSVKEVPHSAKPETLKQIRDISKQMKMQHDVSKKSMNDLKEALKGMNLKVSPTKGKFKHELVFPAKTILPILGGSFAAGGGFTLGKRMFKKDQTPMAKK